MGQLETCFARHDRFSSLHNRKEISRQFDVDQIKLFSITNLSAGPSPQMRSAFNDKKRVDSIHAGTQCRATSGLTTSLREGPAFSPDGTKVSYEIMDGLELPPGSINETFAQKKSISARLSSDVMPAGDQRNLKPQQRSLDGFRKPSPPSIAGRSFKVVKGQILSSATRDARKATQNAVHTAMEQQRRLRISNAIERIAKLTAAHGAKFEILEQAVEWISGINKAITALGDPIGVDGLNAFEVVEGAVEWIRRHSEPHCL